MYRRSDGERLWGGCLHCRMGHINLSSPLVLSDGGQKRLFLAQLSNVF